MIYANITNKSDIISNKIFIMYMIVVVQHSVSYYCVKCIKSLKSVPRFAYWTLKRIIIGLPILFF